MADLARVHLVVSGLVQGVAFRAYTAEEARRLRVAGWVRNLPDGRVEIEAEGERAALEALVGWCRSGPPSARVEDVEASWGPHRGELGPFGIRR
jgi:acylphosphatase